eukprot:m.68417 g.68417  ORF g.68417 m.68417 type:complete len:778 (+) comp11965_c0_seq4:124-2457(+)
MEFSISKLVLITYFCMSLHSVESLIDQCSEFNYEKADTPCGDGCLCTKAVQGNLSCITCGHRGLSSLKFLSETRPVALEHMSAVLLNGNPALSNGAITQEMLRPIRNTSFLGLGENGLTFLPSNVFAEMTFLTILGLLQNKLTTLPPNIFAKNTRLQQLFLNLNNLKSLPSPIFQTLTSLEMLGLSGNQFSTFPPDIFESLSKVYAMSLYENELRDLPVELFAKTTSLLELGMYQNKLSQLPLGIFDHLTKLEGLALHSNAFSQFPPVAVFQNLTRLTSIGLASNGFRDIPEDIFHGKERLALIGLNDNRLTTIPNISCPLLRALILDGNNLRNVNEVQEKLNSFLKVSRNAWNKSYVFIPYFSTSNNPVTCVFNVATLTGFGCSCANEYLLAANGSSCIDPVAASNTKHMFIIVGVSVFGGLLLGGLIMFLVNKGFEIRKEFTMMKNDLGVHEMLLLQSENKMDEMKQAWSIPEDDVTLLKRIDEDCEGASGEVFLAEWDGLRVAVKRLRAYVLELDGLARLDFEKEIDFLRRCRHRNIVRFFGAGEQNGIPFLVTEYVESGSLQTYLQVTDSIPWAQKLSFALDVQAGMEFIHSLDRMHRDLKSGNVLLSRSLRAKVADFGSANFMSESRRGGFVPSATKKRVTAAVGTPIYMAPEVMRGEEYGMQADVWSFGVLLWEIATQEDPDICRFIEGLGDDEHVFLQDLQTKFSEGHRLPTDFPDWPENMAGIITACHALAPFSRPSFANLGVDLEAVADTLGTALIRQDSSFRKPVKK